MHAGVWAFGGNGLQAYGEKYVRVWEETKREAMNRLIVVGSPRANGRSAALADQLFEACIEDCPDDEVALAPVSTLDIAGCTGCDFCRDGETLADLGGPVGENDVGDGRFRCAIRDDMDEVYPLIDVADELIVVSPVYFAGAPSQFKALLDRLQPYFWTDARTQPKRPAVLHVVGEGGDSHGFAPLAGTVRSALAVAGFRLEAVYNWVGKINESGEITAEAEVVELGDAPLAGTRERNPALASSEGNEPGTAKASEGGDVSADSSVRSQDGSYAVVRGQGGRKNRAKLQLSDKQVSSFSKVEGGKASKHASARSVRGGANGDGACVGKGKSDGNAHGGASSKGGSGRSRKAKGSNGRSRRA